jgi:Fe-S cluster assembly protein SufD
VSADVRELYREEFRQTEAALPASGIPWLHSLRAEALDQFLASGFPTPKQEDWKYTDTRQIGTHHFTTAAPAGVTRAQVQPFCFDAITLVFVDGVLAWPLSERVPTGLRVMSLAQTLATDASAIEPWLDHDGSTVRHGFSSLNLALMRDGAFVRIGHEVAVETPIHLLFVSSARPETGMHVRNLIVAERNSRATVVESYVALGEASYLASAYTEIVVGMGATLEHYRVGRDAEAAYHIGGTRAHLERDSRYLSHSVTLGGRMTRHEIACLLDAEGAHAALNGLYVGHGQQHMDHHTRIDHRMPRGTSREWYRGILTDSARGVFSGRVVVHPGAQHTDAEQANHNLVLSPRAEADSRPQFEIYADDVKCAHGATTGRLDADALFYLRSRGLDEARARDLLVYAFAADVLGRMTLAPVRAMVEQELAARLLGGQRIEELVK